MWIKWSVLKLCGLFLKQKSGYKTIQTQNKYEKKQQQKTKKQQKLTSVFIQQ